MQPPGFMPSTKNIPVNLMKYLSSKLLPAFALAICGMLLVNSTSQAEVKKATITDGESKFIQNAAVSSHAETEFAELAVKKATNPKIKAFAETLVTDHKALNKELKKLAAAQNVVLSKEITPAETATLQKLEGATGAEFDKEFIASVSDSHKKCINDYEQASKDHNDKELKVIVDKTIPVLKAHHATALSLAAK
jgi:putative membrane protein